MSPVPIECGGNASFSHPSEIFNPVSYLALDDTDDALFSEADKVVFEDGRIFIADYKLGRLLSFSADGSLALSINKRGRGPQEYVDITGFSVNGDKIFILDNNMGVVLCYSASDGSFIERWPIDFEAWDIEALDNGNLLFAFAPLSLIKNRKREDCYRFVITDPEMKPVSRMIPFDSSGFDLLSYRHYLSASGDKIISAAFDIDGCYVFDRADGSLESSYSLMLDHPIPMDRRADFNALMSNPVNYVAFAPLIGGQVIQFMVRGDAGVEPILYDTADGRLSKNDMTDFSCFICDVVCGTPDGFVALWTGSANYDFLSENGFPKAAAEVESAIHSGAPMLVFYKIKGE